MDNSSETKLEHHESAENQNGFNNLTRLDLHNVEFFVQFECLRSSYKDLQQKSLAMESYITSLQQEKDGVLKENVELAMGFAEVTKERDELRVELRNLQLAVKENENVMEGENETKSSLPLDLEKCCERILVLEEEKNRINGALNNSLNSINLLENRLLRMTVRNNVNYTDSCAIENEKTENLDNFLKDTEIIAKVIHDEQSKRLESVIMGINNLLLKLENEISKFLEERNKTTLYLIENLKHLTSSRECLSRIIERMEDDSSISDISLEEDEQIAANNVGMENEIKRLLLELTQNNNVVINMGKKIIKCEEKRDKEKKELENSIMSLTEENRDISSLLKAALLEKETAERNLNRLKGGGEQKRVAILQIAERGLQKVGFGFMMTNSVAESSDGLSSSASVRSDSSEYEEENVSLMSTWEKIMKKLRLEINQLKRSLEDSRSDNERLEKLVEKQAQQIEESSLYIKDLEERENLLTLSVDELVREIGEAEEEIARWKEACELEVEAGKCIIEERDKEVVFLREELENTRKSLERLNNKLKLKEELASTAMAAEAAAEKSLQLADSRAATLRDRIEELTRQLEEAENRIERNGRRRVRHVCWPWQTLRVNPTASRNRPIRRTLPEMESLLRC